MEKPYKKYNMRIKLFVYGTLKRGGSLYHSYHFGELSDFLGEDSVRGELYGLGWYPVMFETGKHIIDVPGEIFSVPNDLYKTIRDMEEAAGYKTKVVKTKKGEEVKVFYFYDESCRIPRNRIKNF